MKALSLVIGAAAAALATTGASAQSANLTGTYRCVQMCRDGMIGAPAYITRAWPDWSAPDSRIWIDARDESAVYSPDGIRIQFDDGRVWQRVIGPAPVVVWRR